MSDSTSTPRWPGVLVLLFYAVHASYEVSQGRAPDIFWLCHLSSLAIGVGLLLRSATVNGVGVTWLSYGFPMWIVYLASGNEFLPTSSLTHVGSLLIGLWGVRQMGMPRGVAWRAVLVAVAITVCCRFLTPEPNNVNLAHRTLDGWEQVFPSYAAFLATVVSGGVATFLGAEALWRHVLGEAPLAGEERAPTEVLS